MGKAADGFTVSGSVRRLRPIGAILIPLWGMMFVGAHCGAPLGSSKTAAPPEPRVTGPQVETAPEGKEKVAPPVDGSTAEAGPAKQGYLIAYDFEPNTPLYYIIENEFHDSGGVKGLLSYTTSAVDRRTIIQTVKQRNPMLKYTLKQSDILEILWECDRYRIEEKTMTGKIDFDSLRDAYPRVALRDLGKVPGSKMTFAMNPRTGRILERRIISGTQRSGESTSPPTRKRRKLSRTAARCALTRENVSRLLDDLGSLFLPASEKRVGETWRNRRTERVPNFGQAITDYVFRLEGVRKEEDRLIADIEIQGTVRLKAAPEPKKDTTPGRPGTRRGTRQKKRPDYKIEHALCKGSIEFDLTRGELLRMELRRELTLAAEMESQRSENMTVETGSAHVLRVQTRHSAPPKPIIVGGPKPPVEREDDRKDIEDAKKIKAAERDRLARHRGRIQQQHRNGRGRSSDRVVRPKSRLERKPPRRARLRPTTRPSRNPASQPHDAKPRPRNRPGVKGTSRKATSQPQAAGNRSSRLPGHKTDENPLYPRIGVRPAERPAVVSAFTASLHGLGLLDSPRREAA